MAAKKVLVVFGATGNQGGSIINAFLNDSKASAEYSLRGITRDTTSSKAKALQEKGVDTVVGDLNDKDSLKKAFHGAHSVFAVTNYWEKMDAKLEEQQGRNVAEVAKEEGIQHLIFSTLYNIKDLTKGKYPNVYHFDAKANVADYIRELGIPATFFLPGFFMSNLETMLAPSPQPPNTLTLALPAPPSSPFPFFDAAADTGKFVKAIVLKKEEVLGKDVLAATDYYTAQQTVDLFAKVKGKDAKFWQTDQDTYKGFLTGAGMPDYAAQEMYENMAFVDEFGYYGKQSLDWSLSLLDEKPTTLEEFFAKNKKWDA